MPRTVASLTADLTLDASSSPVTSVVSYLPWSLSTAYPPVCACNASVWCGQTEMFLYAAADDVIAQGQLIQWEWISPAMAGCKPLRPLGLYEI